MDLSGIAAAAAKRNANQASDGSASGGPPTQPAPTSLGSPVVPRPPPLTGQDTEKLAAIMAKQREAAEREAPENAAGDEEETIEEIIEEVEEEVVDEGDETEIEVDDETGKPEQSENAALGEAREEEHSHSSGSIEQFNKNAVPPTSPQRAAANGSPDDTTPPAGNVIAQGEGQAGLNGTPVAFATNVDEDENVDDGYEGDANPDDDDHVPPEDGDFEEGGEGGDYQETFDDEQQPDDVDQEQRGLPTEYDQGYAPSYDDYGDPEPMGPDEFLNEPGQGEPPVQQSRDVEGGVVAPVKPVEDLSAADEREIGILYGVLFVACLILIFAIGGVGAVLYLYLSNKNSPSPAPVVNRTITLAPAPQPRVPTIAPAPSPTNSINFTLRATLDSGRTLTSFGSTLSSTGNYLLVGEPNYGIFNKGQCLLYQWQSTSYQPLGAASASADLTLYFGSAIDLELINNVPTALIGAKWTKGVDQVSVDFGTAVYMTYTNSSWVQVGNTMRSDESITEAGADFGAAVGMATSIKRVVVGAPNSSLDSADLRTGKVYTFALSNNGTWVSDSTPRVLQGQAGDYLGTSVALSSDGTRMIAGAPGNGSAPGYVNIYQYRNNAWALVQTKTGQSTERLGSQVAFVQSDGSRFIAGGPNYQNGAGVAVVYGQSNGTTTTTYDVLGNKITGKPGDNLGLAVTGKNGIVAVNAGSSFRVYKFTGGQWVQYGNSPDTGSPVIAIAISSDGSEVTVGLASGIVRSYSLPATAQK